jgi:hypothetical protein
MVLFINKSEKKSVIYNYSLLMRSMLRLTMRSMMRSMMKSMLRSMMRSIMVSIGVILKSGEEITKEQYEKVGNLYY